MSDFVNITRSNNDIISTYAANQDSEGEVGEAGLAIQLAQKAQQAETNSQWLNVKYPPSGSGLTPLKGDGTDETNNLLAFITYASNHLPMTLFFPNGIYGYTDLGTNIAYAGLSIVGASNRGVVFKCLNTVTAHIALTIDAFHDNLNVGFIEGFNMKNIIIEGNANTEVICSVQGIARSSWENVYTRIANGSPTSRGFHFKGVMLSNFKSIMCSTQIDTMATLPYYGIRFDVGTRQGSSVGSSSNNNFIGCYFEGMSTGIYLANGDQNNFIGGSAESCTVNGLLIDSTSRYNTFFGTGFENDSATNYDIDDTGFSTQYINCYASHYVKLRGQSEQISGGLYNQIEIMAGATDCEVKHVKVNYFGGTGNGFTDGGTSTKWRGIYKYNTSSFMYPAKARTTITVGASPFTWTNNTGNMVHLFIGGGTVSALQSVRNGGDPYTIAYNQPMLMTIPPNDGVTVTYTAAPGMSYRELNGF